MKKQAGAVAVQEFRKALEAFDRSGQVDDLDLFIFLGKHLDLEVREEFTVRDLVMATLLKILNKGGNEARFRTNIAQREIAAEWGKRNIVLKARQMGITTYVAARFFIDTITRPGTLTVQVAHDQRSAEDIFRIVHRFQEKLPEFLREGVLKTSRANTRQLVWPRLDSEYRVETAADPNAGRGATIRNLHCSEVASWTRDGRGALASLRAAVPLDGQIVLESTPKGAGGLFYDEWGRAGETGYIRHFLPWWMEPGYRIAGVGAGELTNEERALMEKHGLDEEQIVFRRDRKANFCRESAQEFAESADECFLASGESVFDMEKVEQRLKECGGGVNSEYEKELAEFLPPQEGKRYIVGVDSATGSYDGDYSCAEVVDRETGMQCAEIHAHLPPREFAMKVITLARRYNDAFVVAERNGVGTSVIEHLKYSGYGNLHAENGNVGFTTNVANRPAMVENLVQIMATAPGTFLSPRFLRECRTFVRHHEGVPSASAGSHDDTVMATAIALHVRKLGTPERRSNVAVLE